MQSQGQSRLLGTKHQENMGRGIVGGESVGISIISIVVYPVLLLNHSSFELVNGKVTKYMRQFIWPKWTGVYSHKICALGST